MERSLPNEETPQSHSRFRDSTPEPACPLCAAVASNAIAALSPRQIRRLWDEVGVRLSHEALGPVEARESIVLHRCRECGFDFFDPSLAGGEPFYVELQTQLDNYYPAHCAGFENALRFAGNHGLKNVLDVGCGLGRFLDLAKKEGLDTFGLELNPEAAAIASQNGHHVVCQLMDDFLREGAHGRFQFVTAFEVLEHVPSPMAFVQQAAELVQPGGFLAISVPYRFGLHGLCEFEPHQWPPHHITRWRKQDLTFLGRRHGLIPVSLRADRLTGAELKHFLSMRRRFRTALGLSGGDLGDGTTKLLAWIYRKTGSKYIFPRLGLSIHAIFQSPA